MISETLRARRGWEPVGGLRASPWRSTTNVASFRLGPLLALLSLALTGCITYPEAAGARGVVVDETSGVVLPGAQITRKRIDGALQGTTGRAPELDATETITSDKRGRFDLPPVLRTDFIFSIHPPTSETLAGVFVVTADGYDTKEVRGNATRKQSWRVALDRVEMEPSDE